MGTVDKTGCCANYSAFRCYENESIAEERLCSVLITQGAIVKLDEIARLAGVSRTTASYVINGKAKQYRVSDKTVEKGDGRRS